MRKLLSIVFATTLFLSCKKTASANLPLVIVDTPIVTPTPTSDSFSRGVDVGWLTEMESAGKKFYNTQGQEEECLQLFKNMGIKAVRLRVWVRKK